MERAAAMLDETGLELGVACGEVLSAALTDVAVALPESDLFVVRYFKCKQTFLFNNTFKTKKNNFYLRCREACSS